MFLYCAPGHPSGTSDVPLLQIRDRFVYVYNARKQAAEAYPIFAIIDDKLFTTQWHPAGQGKLPWFTICDNSLVQAAGHPQSQTRTPWFTTQSGPIQTATAPSTMIFTDWPGGGYAAVALAVRNLYRGDPVTTRHVARTLCTGDATVQHDLQRAMRMGLVRRVNSETWVPV